MIEEIVYDFKIGDKVTIKKEFLREINDNLEATRRISLKDEELEKIIFTIVAVHRESEIIEHVIIDLTFLLPANLDKEEISKRAGLILFPQEMILAKRKRKVG